MPQGKGTYGSKKGRPKKNIKSIASQMLTTKGGIMSDFRSDGYDSVPVAPDDPSFVSSDNIIDPGRPGSDIGGSDESYIDMGSCMRTQNKNDNRTIK